MILIRVLNIFWRWLGLFYLFIYDLNIDWWDDRWEKKNSHDIHSFYLTLHENAKKYKEKVRISNNRKIQEGREPRKPKSVEMDNFQDPQVRIIIIFYFFFFLLSDLDIFYRSRAHSLWYVFFFFEALLCTADLGF